MALLTWLLGLGAVTLFLMYDKWKRSSISRRGIPSPPSFPLIGTYEITTKGFVQAIKEFHVRYGKLYGGHVLGTTIVFVGDADMLKEIMVRQFDHFINRRPSPVKDAPLHKAVSLQKNERWKEVRNVLTPAFSVNKMKKVCQIVNEACDQLVEHFDEERKKEYIQCKDLFGSYAMDVVAASFFGLKVDSQKNKDDPFVMHAKEGFNFSFFSPVLLLLTFFPWLGPVFDMFNRGLFPHYIKQFFLEVMTKTVTQRQKDKIKRMDILQMMMDAHELHNEKPTEEDEKDDIANGTAGDGLKNVSINTMKPLEVDELMANSIIFFLAGYETTNTALSFSGYVLATNPDVQEKLIAEVDQIAPTRDDVTYEMMSKMEYLECFVMETLRHYPPAAATDRTCKKDFQHNGFTIKEGESVFINIYSIHHDPDYWPDPEKFDPDRFNKENRGKNHPLAWIPFGYGPRNCIGMRLALTEIKFGLVRLLQKFKFETCKETVIPPELGKSGFIMPKDGIKLRIVSRDEQ